MATEITSENEINAINFTIASDEEKPLQPPPKPRPPATNENNNNKTARKKQIFTAIVTVV